MNCPRPIHRDTTVARFAFNAVLLGCVFCSAVRSEVVYSSSVTNLGPCEIFNSSSFDLDESETTDLCYLPPHALSDCLTGCTSMLISMDGTAIYPYTLNWGYTIDEFLAWQTEAYWYFDAGGCSEGPGCSDPLGPVYIAFRINDGANHYGWLRLRYVYSTSIQLIDYAYESSPETGIEVGAGLPCAGDFNIDNEVDLIDLAIQVSNFGIESGATRDQGDTDWNGSVDMRDFAAFQVVFGAEDCTPTRIPAGGFCIRNGLEACSSDADCEIGGCGSELCYNPEFGGGGTTCDCGSPQGVSCGCVNGQCTWWHY